MGVNDRQSDPFAAASLLRNILIGTLHFFHQQKRFSAHLSTMRFAILFVSISVFTGCANPGQGYANHHPELTPAQRRIFATSRIPSGDDVAGLTREQVKTAMGGDPTTYDKADGEDVWIYSRKKSVAKDLDAPSRDPNSSLDSTRSFTDTAAFDAHGDIDERTSVFFQGGRATHARVVEERQ